MHAIIQNHARCFNNANQDCGEELIRLCEEFARPNPYAGYAANYTLTDRIELIEIMLTDYPINA